MNLALLGNAPHLLETALLLLAAFLIGASVGTLARLAVLRGRAPAAAAESAVAPAAPVAGEPDLVLAPRVDPLPVTAPGPAASLDETMSALVADIASAVGALSGGEAQAEPVADEMKPARVAGRSASGGTVREPVRSVAPTAGERPAPPGPEIAAAAFAEASRGAVGAGEPPVEVAAVAAEALVAELSSSVQPAPEEVAASGEDASGGEAAAEVAELASPAEPVAGSRAKDEPRPASKRRVREESDESAAMRAIEGNWSPPRKGTKPSAATGPKAADAAVVASGEAVAAAVRAAEAAMGAPVAAPVARPAGLGTPRGGAKDDLTRIVGVLPILETALNGLGLYHFDQIAQLTELNVSWLENYLGIQGRIGRERWREQARRLADDGAARQAAQ